MHEIGRGSSITHWLELVRGAEADWDRLFEGYNACVDWPSAFYWRTLINEYPDAKVLLTMRTADSWWSSFQATILKHIVNYSDPDGLAQQLVAEQVFEGRPDDRNHAIKIYKRNIEEVVATVAPERLLVHNLGDGWVPLCKWLNIPEPDMQYPQANTTEEFLRKLRRNQ